jgi:hypothetical protein
VKAKKGGRARVGELRPSQLLHTFGVGAVVDLPNLSTMILGLDYWDTTHAREIPETRLLAAVREQLGLQVERLVLPPAPSDAQESFLPTNDAEQTIGVPVTPFPRWMRCPLCNFLAPLNCGVFELKTDPFRADRARYVHVNCAKAMKPPPLVPARFLVACEAGHLDDFPWYEFVHRGARDCTQPSLELVELGASGEAADISARCKACDKKRRMSEAFGEEGRENLPKCTARRPQLRDRDDAGCDKPPKAILLGASSAWFAATRSALSLPVSHDPLRQLVETHWDLLRDVDSPEVLGFLRKRGQLSPFADFALDAVWRAMEARRTGAGEVPEGDPRDLKTPEWEVLVGNDPTRNGPDFRLREVSVPEGFESQLARVVLAERLREVTALVAFTRIFSPSDYGDIADIPAELRAPISRRPPTFVPAAEVRGEGIFLQFREDVLAAWVAESGARARTFLEAHRRWRAARGIEPASAGFPGLRYVVLHTFAHALMRQLALECGYAAPSLRERIYATAGDGTGTPTAGVLIYTAAADSEGTLGGLVRLGEPAHLGRHIHHALEELRLCTSDPLCAEHHPWRAGVTLHAAACHACLFAPETSCEHGNRYLDRAVLVETVAAAGRGFFG